MATNINDLPEEERARAARVATGAARVIFGSTAQDTITISPIRATSIDLAPSEAQAQSNAQQLANSLARNGLDQTTIAGMVKMQLSQEGLPDDAVERIANQVATQAAMETKAHVLDAMGGARLSPEDRIAMATQNSAAHAYGEQLISEITALFNDPNNPMLGIDNKPIRLDENGVAEALLNKDREKLINVKIRATSDTLETFDAATWARLQNEGAVDALQSRVHQGVSLGAVENAHLSDILIANAPEAQREAMREQIHRLGAGAVLHTMLKENPALMQNLVDMAGDRITNPTLVLQAIANGDRDTFRPLAIETRPDGKIALEGYGRQSVLLASNMMSAVGDNIRDRQVDYTKTLATLATQEVDPERTKNFSNERPGARYNIDTNFAHISPQQVLKDYRAQRDAELANSEQPQKSADRAR
ncbi:MAG: hypothetical protein J0L97_10735 [Alphaproteobacteria bacterium]|nr:hypothetical protein [Alphaproteobacteria bacterium]